MTVHDLIVITGVGVTLILGLVIPILSSAWRIATRLARIEEALRTLKAEVEPNSGTSLKDRVVAIEMMMRAERQHQQPDSP